VANAVAASMPAGSPVGLGMTLTDTSVVVEVFDRAPGEPAPGTATAEAESGYAPGRHADYSPGSPDLDRLVHLMGVLSAIKVPDDPGPFKRAEGRWKPYLDHPETAAVFAGPVLTHSDWTPDNVLVSDQRTWLIDMAQAAKSWAAYRQAR
jgi:hypothetical protein